MPIHTDTHTHKHTICQAHKHTLTYILYRNSQKTMERETRWISTKVFTKHNVFLLLSLVPYHFCDNFFFLFFYFEKKLTYTVASPRWLLVLRLVPLWCQSHFYSRIIKNKKITTNSSAKLMHNNLVHSASSWVKIQCLRVAKSTPRCSGPRLYSPHLESSQRHY